MCGYLVKVICYENRMLDYFVCFTGNSFWAVGNNYRYYFRDIGVDFFSSKKEKLKPYYVGLFLPILYLF